jgi:hypothetical protein
MINIKAGFIELTTLSVVRGDELDSINVEKIIAIGSNENSKATRIRFGYKCDITVKESRVDILEAINAYQEAMRIYRKLRS